MDRPAIGVGIRICKLKSWSDYNDNNHPSLAPFTCKKSTLFVEKHYLDAWNQITLTALQSHFDQILPTDKILRGQFTRNENDSTIELPDWYHNVYKSVCQQSNAKFWWYILPECQFVELSDSECDQLLNDDLENTRVRLTAAMKTLRPHPLKNDDAWFVKFGDHSTKHDYAPRPVVTATEALEHLLPCSDSQKGLARRTSQGILVRPWINDINSTCEVRVFLRQNVVVGVSQQSLYEVKLSFYSYNSQNVIDACQQLWDEVSARLRPEHRLDGECTFDAYIVNRPIMKAFFIEINSAAFGWGPAGASLFSWAHDPPPLVGECPQFRFTIK